MEVLNNTSIEKILAYFGFVKMEKKKDWCLFLKGTYKALLFLSQNGETKKCFLQSSLKSYDKQELFTFLSFDLESDEYTLSEMDDVEIIPLSKPLEAHMEEAVCLSITSANNAAKILESYFDNEVAKKVLSDFEGLFFEMEGKAAFPLSYSGEIQNYLLLSPTGITFLNENKVGAWHSKYYQGSTSCFLSFDPVPLFSHISEMIPMDYFAVLVHPEYNGKTMDKLLSSIKNFGLLPFNLLENTSLCGDNFRFLVAMANMLNMKNCQLDCSLSNNVWTFSILSQEKLDVKTLNFANGLKSKLEVKNEANIETLPMRGKKQIIVSFQHRLSCLDIAMEELISYFGLETYVKRFLV